MSAGNDESSDSGRLTRLEQQMEQVTGRLAALERAAAPAPRPALGAVAPAAGAGTGPGPAAMPGPGALPDPAGDRAVFGYSGRGQFGPNDLGVHKWARLSDVMDADPDMAARVFTALASPARITLLRALLNGPRSSQELRRELDDPSAGQLYHHLRELMAAGLAVQLARSVYAIPRGSEVDLCLQIVIAARMTSAISRYPPPGSEEPDEDLPGTPLANGDQAAPGGHP